MLAKGEPGGRLNIKMSSYQYRDPHVKIRQSCDRLLFNMRIPIPWKDSLYIETASGVIWYGPSASVIVTREVSTYQTSCTITWFIIKEASQLAFQWPNDVAVGSCSITSLPTDTTDKLRRAMVLRLNMSTTISQSYHWKISRGIPNFFGSWKDQFIMCIFNEAKPP